MFWVCVCESLHCLNFIFIKQIMCLICAKDSKFENSTLVTFLTQRNTWSPEPLHFHILTWIVRYIWPVQTLAMSSVTALLNYEWWHRNRKFCQIKGFSNIQSFRLSCHNSSLSQQPDKQNSSYWAYSCNHWMNLLCAAAVVCESFFEEEVDFGIIGVSAIWDNMSIHKNRLWNEKVYQKDETKRCISISNDWLDFYWLLQGSAEYTKYQQVSCSLLATICVLKFNFTANFRGAIQKQWYYITAETQTLWGRKKNQGVIWST